MRSGGIRWLPEAAAEVHRQQSRWHNGGCYRGDPVGAYPRIPQQPKGREGEAQKER